MRVTKANFFFLLLIYFLISEEQDAVYVRNNLISTLHKINETAILTHYRPAMPFGNRKIYLRASFQFSFDYLKNIIPLET